ncbi:MAG: 3-hydroxyacyl-CoA dehydrogenase family protein [Promethearchaeota archaeon]|nr:MAG: 3-hydroxyacyl-CoA dehydrogenase family protein [Candidatus Lokiarchaeota archaeon]
MELKDINNVLIIGAGTMGHGISQVYAQNGFNVFLVDTDESILSHAMKLIDMNLNLLADFKRIDRDEIESIKNKITCSTDLTNNAEKADVVVEAIKEVPELKLEVFKKLADYCRNDTILASNTSSLDIFKILKAISHPERIITHHWFCPPYIIPSVEISPGRKTSQETIELSIKLHEKLGKIPIVMEKFSPNYIVNKIQNAISGVMYELMMRNLANAEQIDLAIKTTLGIRLPIVGIVQMHDFTGLDLVEDIISAKGGNVPLISEKVKKGDLGAKTGKGHYSYNNRGELEILRKRDILYLRQLEFLEENTQFKPI